MTKVTIGVVLFSLAIPGQAVSEDPIALNNRLEFFIDDYLIAEMRGDVCQQLQRPDPKEVVFVADQPWEGNTSGYYTLFQDGQLYRMIYRGWQHDQDQNAVHPEATCYAESKDGIHWTRPEVGLFEWDGSKENNIVWLGKGSHNFTAFLDGNPAAPPEARYKALGGGSTGLLAFQSPDCIHWEPIQEDPVITNGTFDSQNLAFWDSERGHYRAYWRYFTKGNFDGFRAIRTATSQDFIHWDCEADLTYTEGTPAEHLYTNAVQEYFRAPHLFIGFPTRYLPKQGQRVEPLLMSSRCGVHFHRWPDPVIPEEAPADRKGNRSNYMTWGMFQLPGQPSEISVYATENYYESTPGRVRRFAYRLDGFVALHGGRDGGTVTTKPLCVEGRLLLNYQVRSGGSLQLEVVSLSGDLLGRSNLLTGDAIDQPVAWELEPDLGEEVVQLRFSLKNADLFSLRFD